MSGTMYCCCKCNHKLQIIFCVNRDITAQIRSIDLNLYWSTNISLSSSLWATRWRISPDMFTCSILVFYLSALHCTLLSAVFSPSHPIAKTSLGYLHLLYVLESYFVVRYARRFERSVRKIYICTCVRYVNITRKVA